MTWTLTWGPKIDTLKAVEQNTGVTPQALLNRPELQKHLRFYWDLFFELSEEREESFAGNDRPITLTGFLPYCTLYGWTRQEAQDIWEYVRMLDRIWLRLRAERRATAPKDRKSVV